MNSKIRLQITIQYPQIIALIWLDSHINKTSELKTQRKHNKVRLQIIETAAITFVQLINPINATWAVPILKLCFMVLKLQQESKNK
jgi:hypothetical protein